MTVREAIERVDASKPNTFPIEDKVMWLAYLDGIIFEETIHTHEPIKKKPIIEDGEIKPFPEIVEEKVPDTHYSADNMDAELLAEYPYSELYPAFLKMKIDEENGETARYNNSAAMFNSLHADYLRWYNKYHMPKQTHIRYR